MAIALVLAVAAPELAPPAGAVSVRSDTGTAMHAGSGAHVQLTARRTKKRRRKLTPAQKKARLARYLKTHPAVLAAHLKAQAAKGQTTPTAAVTKQPAAKKKKKTKGRYVVKKAKKKKAKKGAKKKAVKGAKKKRAVLAAAAAKKSKGHPLGLTGWLEILFLALLPFGVVALVLLGSDFQRRPRAPSPSRRRKTLVITPMNRNR